jgi:HK97 family phage prohead protease
MGNRETKTFALEIGQFDAEGRTVEGHAAVFGNIDLQGDIIYPGAFRKTLTERGPLVKFLWDHDPSEPIGRLVELREDETGLFFRGVISDTRRGRDVLALLRDGAVDGMSIGYEPVRGGVEFEDLGNGQIIRRLKEIKLWEISLVTFPANELARVDALKAASGKTDLPIASRDASWDARAAEGRVKGWAEAEDAPNSRYAQAFFWYDEANADQFGAYKLPFADVIDGELTAVPRAIFAAAAAVQGARGGVDIPDDDVGPVKARISRYYARMREKFEDDNLVAPWEKEARIEQELKQLAARLDDVVNKLVALEAELTARPQESAPTVGRQDELARLLEIELEQINTMLEV